MAIIVKLDDVLHARRMTLTELSARVGAPLVGSGTVRVLAGDAVTYGLFVVLGMAYRRRNRPLPRRWLGAGALGAAGATAAYVAWRALLA